MLGKILVSKQGDVFRVAVDPSSNMPLPLASYDDEPAGAFMQTFVGMPELRASFPGREFQFLEKPKTAENVVAPLSSEQQNKVRKMMEAAGVSSPPTQPSKAVLVPVSVATGQALPVVSKEDDARYLHAQEFLKRLQMAREYASKKNQRELDIKIAAVTELLGEVFE